LKNVNISFWGGEKIHAFVVQEGRMGLYFRRIQCYNTIISKVSGLNKRSK